MSIAGIGAALVGLAYLCGSIPFGKIVAARYGIDIQKKGSGNIGFANVRRTLGWRAGLIVLAGDVAKGLLPVLLARQFLPDHFVLVVAAVAVTAHIFPVWLKFKGGKGIATGLGVTLAIQPLIGVLGLAVFILGVLIYRRSGPSSVTAAWSLPVFCLFFAPPYLYFYIALAVLATWTHRSNLKQLLTKAEHARP